MDQRNEELLDAITAALPPLLSALKALDHAARHLHPPNIPALGAAVEPLAQPLRDGLAQFEAVDFPEHLRLFKAQVLRAGECACRAFDGLRDAAAADGPMAAYRALGQRTRAVEALYPIAAPLPPLNRFFVSKPSARKTTPCSPSSPPQTRRAATSASSMPTTPRTSAGDSPCTCPSTTPPTASIR